MNDKKIVNLFSDLREEIKKSENSMREEIKKSENSMREEIKNLEMKMDQKFDTVNLNIAKLEHVMYERTDILFDAQKASEDTDRNLKSEIKSLDDRLDYYGGKIFKLESKKK